MYFWNIEIFNNELFSMVICFIFIFINYYLVIKAIGKVSGTKA